MTQERSASDSESDWSMDSIEAREFADQNPDLDDPDSPGSTNSDDPNLAILAAILNQSQNVSRQKILSVYLTFSQIRKCKKKIAVSFQNSVI
jgi:hypothetical protein